MFNLRIKHTFWEKVIISKNIPRFSSLYVRNKIYIYLFWCYTFLKWDYNYHGFPRKIKLELSNIHANKCISSATYFLHIDTGEYTTPGISINQQPVHIRILLQRIYFHNIQIHKIFKKGLLAGNKICPKICLDDIPLPVSIFSPNIRSLSYIEIRGCHWIITLMNFH